MIENNINETIILSEEDFNKFEETIKNPKKIPNKELQKMFKNYNLIKDKIREI